MFRIPSRAFAWLSVSFAMVLIAACASIPPPTSTMSRAESSIQAAKKAGAADADPVDLDFAQGKYGQAKAAMAAKKYGQASDLAEESLADSNLALTKARLATLRNRIQSQSRENARLRKQLLESAPSASSPPPASIDSATQLPETVLPSPAASSGAPAPASSANDPAAQEGHS